MIHSMDEPRGQTIYIVFGEQADPDPDGDRIDPIIAVFADESRCFALEAASPGPRISWEERIVQDAGRHLRRDGDTIYLTHHHADLRRTPEGTDTVEFTTAPDPVDAYYDIRNASRAAATLDVQQVVIGAENPAGVGSAFHP